MITPEVLEALANEEEVQMATLTGWETIQLEGNTFGRSTPERPWVTLSATMMMGMFKDRIWRIKPETMNFLEAVARMKNGARMRREGWGHSRTKPMRMSPTGCLHLCPPEVGDDSLTDLDYTGNDWYEVSGE